MNEGVNKERVRKLVDALRSGDYVQTDGRLRRRDTEDGKPQMCCLGVACDVSGIGAWEPGKYDGQAIYCQEYIAPGSAPNAATLPGAVARWYGFNSDVPNVRTDEGSFPLTHLNDSGDYSFEQIADLIEREFLGGEDGR